MADDLINARFKLVRAREQCDALKDEIVSWFEKNPYVLVIEPELKPGEYVIRIKFSDRPNPYWSTTVGEIAHNVRSALNYLACGLVEAGGGKVTSTTQFPIYDKKGKLKDRDHAMVKGMTEAAFTVVESLQPCNRITVPTYPLYFLAKLSNMDKHRTQPPPGLVAVHFRLEASTPLQPVRFDVREFNRGPYIDGAVVARIKGEARWAEAEVDVNGKFTPEIVFDNTWRWADLVRVVDFVENEVVERVRPHLRTDVAGHD